MDKTERVAIADLRKRLVQYSTRDPHKYPTVWLDVYLKDINMLLALIEPGEVVAWEVAKNGKPILPPPEVSKADAERRMQLLQERVHPPTGLSVVPLTCGGRDE